MFLFRSSCEIRVPPPNWTLWETTVNSLRALYYRKRVLGRICVDGTASLHLGALKNLPGYARVLVVLDLRRRTITRSSRYYSIGTIFTHVRSAGCGSPKGTEL
jgi:hypothetical protein